MHKITDIDEKNKTGVCSICGKTSIKIRERRPSGRLRVECASLTRAHQTRYNHSIKGIASRAKHRGRNRGFVVTDDVIHQYVSTDKCECCGEIQSNVKNLCIDHCHVTGKIRGILCRNCNTGLGFFKDSQIRLLQAIDYLKKNTSPSLVKDNEA